MAQAPKWLNLNFPQAVAAIGTVLDSRFVKLLFVAVAFRFCAG